MKPTLAKGTRDFSPQDLGKRNYIFETIKTVFKKYGYQEIQTPTFENLTTLTGKYGDEGDRLIFKIVNSGDYLAKAPSELLDGRDSSKLIPHICDKALRYDLTVPFARYVVMHQHTLTWPFKRFQIQPVWRADRPQKGRYREFYQCDVDVVGSTSLLNEAEFVLIYHEGLTNLGLKDFTIKINNRKLLTGIAEFLGKPELIIDMTIAIDKLDKIGVDGVTKELLERGFTEADVEKLSPLFTMEKGNEQRLATIKTLLKDSEVGQKGVEEIQTVLTYLEEMTGQSDWIHQFVEIDLTLARGLNYYTGCIFEVKSNEVSMGSIGGGGRYDDLTGMFGLKGLSGVGISFGADRIYDVMQELNLFPEDTHVSTQVLITNFSAEAERYALPILHTLRKNGIATEMYPEVSKLKKQLSYADNKRIPYVIIIGDEEIQQGHLSIKNMETGTQRTLESNVIVSFLSKEAKQVD
jgi:histidyl-tRNA synthetase